MLAVLTFLGVNGLIGFVLAAFVFQLAHKAHYGSWFDF